MGYILENIRKERYKEIVQNASNLDYWSKAVNGCLRRAPREIAWAVDNDLSKYLVKFQLIPGRAFIFQEDFVPDKIQFKLLVNEICEAFKAYGRYGLANISGDALTPKFKDIG